MDWPTLNAKLRLVSEALGRGHLGRLSDDDWQEARRALESVGSYALMSIPGVSPPRFKVGDSVVLTCYGKAECAGTGVVDNVRPYDGPVWYAHWQYDLRDGAWADGHHASWCGIREEWLAKAPPDGWTFNPTFGLTPRILGFGLTVWMRDGVIRCKSIETEDDTPVPEDARAWMESEIAR